MNTGELLVDIIKTGAITLIGCKTCKALGQKDIADFVHGTGWMLCGVDMVLLITPICKWVMDFTNAVGKNMEAINQFFQLAGKAFKIGG